MRTKEVVEFISDAERGLGREGGMLGTGRGGGSWVARGWGGRVVEVREESMLAVRVCGDKCKRSRGLDQRRYCCEDMKGRPLASVA